MIHETSSCNTLFSNTQINEENTSSNIRIDVQDSMSMNIDFDGKVNENLLNNMLGKKKKKHIDDSNINKHFLFSIKKINKNSIEDTINLNGKHYLRCRICNKKYTAYPTLYSHRRNKHNIIPIKCPENIFKKAKILNVKHNYNAIKPGRRIEKKFTKKLINLTLQNLFFFYHSEPSSCLYNKKLILEEHPFIKSLKKYQIIFSNGINSQINGLGNDRESGDMSSIDDIFMEYFILVSRVINRQESLINDFNRFFILFREYLNLDGWDSLFRYLNHEIEDNNSKEYPEFTQNNYICYIPDFVEKFLTVFMMIPDFLKENNIDDYRDIASNFCNFLHVNDFTNLKVIDRSKKP